MSACSALIIDDDAFYAHCLKDAFASAGIECVHAPATDARMELIRKIRPNVILLALLINGLDGSDVLAEIKADAETQAIPVIMLTHLGMREDVERCLQKGACAFMIKSQHSTSEMVACIQKILTPAKSL